VLACPDPEAEETDPLLLAGALSADPSACESAEAGKAARTVGATARNTPPAALGCRNAKARKAVTTVVGIRSSRFIWIHLALRIDH
jgi:hypothetical protein